MLGMFWPKFRPATIDHCRGMLNCFIRGNARGFGSMVSLAELRFSNTLARGSLGEMLFGKERVDYFVRLRGSRFLQ